MRRALLDGLIRGLMNGLFFVGGLLLMAACLANGRPFS